MPISITDGVAGAAAVAAVGLEAHLRSSRQRVIEAGKDVVAPKPEHNQEVPIAGR